MPEQYFSEWKPKYPLAEKLGEGVDYLAKTVRGFGSLSQDVDQRVLNKAANLAVDFSGLEDIASTAKRVAYDEPLTEGKGETLRLKPETAGAVFGALPATAPALKASRGAAKVGGQMLMEAASTPIGARSAQRGIFGGTQARFADLVKLEDAKREAVLPMPQLNRGENDRIRKQTGWMFDPADKKWKFEIDDSGATVSKLAVSNTKEETFPVTDVITHDKAFEQYPHLKDIKVITDPKTLGASFDKETNTIRVNALTANRPALLRQHMLHELEHAVQAREGHGYGGSAKEIQDRSLSLGKDLKQNANAFHTAAAVKEYMAEHSIGPEEALRRVVADNKHAGSLADVSATAPDIIDRAGRPGEAASLRRFGDTVLKRAEGHVPLSEEEALDAYMKLPGEAMARNVERRSSLSAEQRRDIDPLAHLSEGGSLDVKPEDIKAWSPAYRMSGKAASEPIQAPVPEDKYKSKVLERLPPKMVDVPRQHLEQELKRPDVTQAEKDAITSVMADLPGDKVPRSALELSYLDKTKNLRLEPKVSNDYADYGLGNISRTSLGSAPRLLNAEAISAEEAKRAVQTRTTLYRSPIETSDANHFGDPNYFGHTRSFDEGGVRHVVEVQSDLGQHVKPLKAEELAKIEPRMAELENAIAEIEKNPFSHRQFVVQKIRSDGGSYPPAYEELQARFNSLPKPIQDSTVRNIKASGVQDIPYWGYMHRDEEVHERLSKFFTDPNFGPGLGSIPWRNTVESKRGMRTVAQAISDAIEGAKVELAELKTKLGSGKAGQELSPIIKQWPKRLVREELAAARKEYEEAQRQARNLEVDIVETRKDAELAAPEHRAGYADHADHLERQRGKWMGVDRATPQDKVRFATADTVAKVEGWGDAIDALKADLKQAKFEVAQHKKYLAHPATSDERVDRIKRLLADKLETVALIEKDLAPGSGYAEEWITRQLSPLKRDLAQREQTINEVFADVQRTGVPDDRLPKWKEDLQKAKSRLQTAEKAQRVSAKSGHLFYNDHAGIYARHKAEVENFLTREHEGQAHTDKHGHTWIEVPLDPSHRRVQMLGTAAAVPTAAVAAAAAYQPKYSLSDAQ